MPFLMIFVIIPLIEIALFIQVGGRLGITTTLLLCVLTAMIGAVLLRSQGLKTLFSARTALDQGALPVYELFDGICLAIAGITLMTPGFFTDAIGFALLVPPLRIWLRGTLARYFETHIRNPEKPPDKPDDRNNGNIIEGDFERLDDDETS